MKYLAHITFINGMRCEQTVRQHLCQTAAYAGEILKPVGFYNAGFLAGIVHDAGKYSVGGFQTYLEAAAAGEDVKRGSVTHSTAGLRFLFEKYYTDKHKPTLPSITCEIIAYAVGAHHGLFDALDLQGISGFKKKLERYPADSDYRDTMEAYLSDCISEKEIDGYFQKAMAEVFAFWEKLKVDWLGRRDRRDASGYCMGMLSRMVLSALIEGDRRDTAEFMGGRPIGYQKGNRNIWNEQLTYMERKLNEQCFETSEINNIRRQISDMCKVRALDKGGIYRISVPTGSGKTLTMLRYALTHAKAWDKDRIFFVIPLLSVLEQNSQVIRSYLKDETLLIEHQSNFHISNESSEALDLYELLTETWEAPIILTTLVQLLNTFFERRTSSVRRFHSLRNSVIVIDEVQSVPTKLVYMFNMALNFLAEYMNTTIVLCSATQPVFGEITVPLRYAGNAELIPADAIDLSVFKRTIIHPEVMAKAMTMEELADFSQKIIASTQSLLIVCNTKKSTAALYEQLKKRGDYTLFHLSTSMCMQHRKDTLDCIFKKLAAGNEKVVCVSTQLVEAGVDFSFESVIRVKAGIDNVVQAAGRCNRNAEYGRLCHVYIVALKDESLSHLRDIVLAQQSLTGAKARFDSTPENYDNDFISLKMINLYYELLFGRLEGNGTFGYPVKDGGLTYSLYELLAANISFKRYALGQKLRQPFKTAGDLFHVFESDTMDVVVPYNNEAENLIEKLTAASKFDFTFMKTLVEKVKPYTIQLRDYQKEKLADMGLIRTEKDFFVLNKNAYSQETGLFQEEDVTQWMIE